MTESQRNPPSPRVAVVGGGLAAMAAAAALSGHEPAIELFEARRRLGGRAGSFHDPQIGGWVDHCQHVAMGCCTNLADFCRRAGIDDCFGRHRRLHFFGPRAVRYDVAAAAWLPAPLHLLPGLLRLGYLSFAERVRIIRAIGRLARRSADDLDDCQTMGAWLRRQGQSPRAIEMFWSVLLASALGERPDRIWLPTARKVLVDGFAASARAYELEVPRVPLAEIFDRRLSAWLGEHGVTVHLGARVKQIAGDSRRARGLVLADGTRHQFDFILLAVPWHQVRSLLPPEMLAVLPELAEVDRIEPVPITAVHLWFDRPIMPLAHAVLVGRLSQWVFNHGPQPGGRQQPEPQDRTPGHHYQVVISGSAELAGRSRDEVVEQVRRELGEIWPAARKARLVHRRTLTQPAAVFSVRPGVERLRPLQETPIPNLFLAGDWTATGWPATMESAVRSGYLAAEAILRALGKHDRLLVADLPQNRLARLLLRAGDTT